MMKKLTMESLLDIEAVYFENLFPPFFSSYTGKKDLAQFAGYLSGAQEYWPLEILM